MGQNIKDFSLSEEELANALEIEPAKLFSIITFFDSDPDDDWELKEGIHFVFLNKTQKAKSPRMFSELGAYAIASYLDATEPKSILEVIKEFFTKHKQKIRRSQIIRKIYSHSFPIYVKENQFFITKKATISILCTNYPKLNQSFEYFRRSRPLVPDQEVLIENKKVTHYSFKGLEKVSRHLSEDLKKEDRRRWCKDAAEVCMTELKKLKKEEETLGSRIQSAKNQAKRRDKNICQITGLERGKPDTRLSHQGQIYRGNMVVHHIFCRYTYPHLADSSENLVTLAEPVHKLFHQTMGGTNKPCTIDDLIEFATNYYPDHPDALSRLYDFKQRLGPQSPSQPRFLYLKAAEDTEKS